MESSGDRVGLPESHRAGAWTPVLPEAPVPWTNDSCRYTVGLRKAHPTHRNHVIMSSVQETPS